MPSMAQAQILRLAQVRAALSSGEARRLRTEARLSLAEVAEACGADQSTVWRWERGERRIRNGELALAYANLLDDLRRHTQNSSGHDGGARSSHLTPPTETASTAYRR